MFEVSNHVFLISLVVTLICGGFIYYSMKTRLNQVEADMSSMFNLVSSLNDEQKRLGNLLMYNINAQPQYDEQMDYHGETVETSDESTKEMNDEPKMINLFLQNQEDLRLVVSDDESECENDEHDANRDDEHDDEHDANHDANHDDEHDDNNDDQDDEHDANRDDGDIKKLNVDSLKLNELKELLNTIDLDKNELITARKLKKKELIYFIKNKLNKQTFQDLTETPDETNADDKIVNHNSDTEDEEVVELLNETLQNDDDIDNIDNLDNDTSENMSIPPPMDTINNDNDDNDDDDDNDGDGDDDNDGDGVFKL